MKTTTTHSPATLGRFGVFLTCHVGAASQRRAYIYELPGMAAMIATASDEHAAAIAACRWLAQMDRTDDATKAALIIRDRDRRENVGLIQWVERWNSNGTQRYRYSIETWNNGEAPRVGRGLPRNRLAALA